MLVVLLSKAEPTRVLYLRELPDLETCRRPELVPCLYNHVLVVFSATFYSHSSSLNPVTDSEFVSLLVRRYFKHSYTDFRGLVSSEIIPTFLP
jgi:hypothetical protein